MPNVLDVLKERGFIKQVTFEEDLYKMFDSEKVTFYAGFDPTADSLHVGHYLLLVMMAHLQRAGHKPIALVGGGTVVVGDPSGRSDMRKMLTAEDMDNNVARFKQQLSKFLDFSNGNALMVNNADWLLNLNYLNFLREIGVHFSVNRMLTAECYKARMEKGLTFLEFNYMLMQAYDFLVLNREQGAVLQVGGDDQWSNILAGADLIRRKEQKPAFALTCTLLTNSEGKKMGKTQSGAVWLDAEKTSPYDFYQYWRNIDDADVEKCLKLLTFLPLPEIAALCAHQDERMNHAKEVLAYTLTETIHGTEAAQSAQSAARAAFGTGNVADMPTVTLDNAAFLAAPGVVDVLFAAGLIKSKSEGRRLIEGGAISVNQRKISAFSEAVLPEDIENGAFVLHKGKKIHVVIQLT